MDEVMLDRWSLILTLLGCLLLCVLGGWAHAAAAARTEDSPRLRNGEGRSRNSAGCTPCWAST